MERYAVMEKIFSAWTVNIASWLGYLPHGFGFYPEFTVEDYLLYIAALKGIRPVVAKKRVKELIAKVGLSKAAHKKMKKIIWWYEA